jgi:hypothetical protein
VAPLGGVRKQKDQSEHETECKATNVGDVAGAGEFGAIVVENSVPTEKLGKQTVTQTVSELGK